MLYIVWGVYYSGKIVKSYITASNIDNPPHIESCIGCSHQQYAVEDYADNSNINGDVGLVLCYGIKDGMSIGEYWVSFSGAR